MRGGQTGKGQSTLPAGPAPAGPRLAPFPGSQSTAEVAVQVSLTSRTPSSPLHTSPFSLCSFSFHPPPSQPRSLPPLLRFSTPASPPRPPPQVPLFRAPLPALLVALSVPQPGDNSLGQGVLPAGPSWQGGLRAPRTRPRAPPPAYPRSLWAASCSLALRACPLSDLFSVHLSCPSLARQKDSTQKSKQKKKISLLLPFTKETSDLFPDPIFFSPYCCCCLYYYYLGKEKD